MILSKVEQVALAADQFVVNGRSYTDSPITADTVIDERISRLHDEFIKGSPDIDRNTVLQIADEFFVLSKWNLYKTVYRFEQPFFDVLIDTEDAPFYQESLKNLPVNCFFVACPQPGLIGFFTYVETKESETFFYVISVDDVRGTSMHSAGDSMWIANGQKIGDALTAWMQTINGERGYEEFFERAIANMKTAVQVAYYLSAQNAVTTEIRTPKSKRPKRTNGTPLNLRQWAVGYRIGIDYNSKSLSSAYGNDDVAEVADRREDRGNSPRPHLRKAHWHHYWVGEGRNKLVLKWLEPIWVNGNPDDIIATEHRVLEA